MLILMNAAYVTSVILWTKSQEHPGLLTRFRPKIILWMMHACRAYMAPEYLGKGRISPKADIYSFGVLILEIVTGQCAKGDDTSDDFITWVGTLPLLDGLSSYTFSLVVSSHTFFLVCKQVHGEWSKRDVRALIYVDDESLSGDCIAQAQNCIEIAMDCIQEDPNSRPDAEMIRQRLLRV